MSYKADIILYNYIHVLMNNLLNTISRLAVVRTREFQVTNQKRSKC